MSKSVQKRFYSILNHNRVTVACCSNLKVAVEWVNSHPSRSLSEVLQYHPTYHVMRKRGKVLFELGGLECSIVESSLLFTVDQAHSSQPAGSLAQNSDMSSVNVSKVVNESVPVASVTDVSCSVDVPCGVSDREFALFHNIDIEATDMYRNGRFRTFCRVGTKHWMCYTALRFTTYFSDRVQAMLWVDQVAANEVNQVGAASVSEVVDEKGSQLLELGKLGCTWKVPDGGTIIYVYFGGGCIYAGSDWAIAVRVAQEKVAHSLISTGRVA